MDTLTLNLKDIAFLLGLVCSVWAVYKITLEVAEPRKALEMKVDTLERWHREDHERIKEMETLQEDIFRCVYQLIRHEATGNGTEDFKTLLNDLDKKVRV